MAKGQAHKKIKTVRKNKQSRLDRQYELRSAAAHVQTTNFLACQEVILYHFLQACTLASLISLSHTSLYFRTLVKTLHRIRLLGVVEFFIGHAHVEDFFTVLENTDSAIGGSSMALVLAPPIHDTEDWLPNDLNIYCPLGLSSAWSEFFNRVRLPPAPTQPGVSRLYRTVTTSHVIYNSQMHNTGSVLLLHFFYNIAHSDRYTGMCIATCSNTYILYPKLVNERRALEGWHEPSIQRCLDIQERGFRRSISTMSWTGPCGWNCPAVWRRIQGLRGVGVFCWGGYGNAMPDNGTVGVPFTDVAMKWRLSDRCTNVHCPWFKDAVSNLVSHSFSLSTSQPHANHYSS
ncbi:hypothetical protein C8R44DRAFT_650797 [Mycena epipterygia]|nr:hypothetical protein C8R44DRAFT_650797 [Mycena epipterygia]